MRINTCTTFGNKENGPQSDNEGALKQTITTITWMLTHVIGLLAPKLESMGEIVLSLELSIPNFAPSCAMLEIEFIRGDHKAKKAFKLKIDCDDNSAKVEVPKDPTPPTTAIWSDSMTPEQLSSEVFNQIKELAVG